MISARPPKLSASRWLSSEWEARFASFGEIVGVDPDGEGGGPKATIAHGENAVLQQFPAQNVDDAAFEMPAPIPRSGSR